MTGPGLLTLTRPEYDSLPFVNWSTAKHALDSAKHYRHACDSPNVQTDSMLVGSVVHTAVFEPERMDEYATWDCGRRAGKEWEAFKASREGRTIITRDQLLGAIAIADAVRAYPPAARLLKAKGGIFEGVLVWTDPETGLKCKARPDLVSDGYLVELKTTNDIEPRAFGRQCDAMHYHGQIGMYNLGLLANGLKRKKRFIVVENKPPFDCVVYTVDEDQLYAGEEAAKKALRIVAEARRKRRYAGRYDKAQPLQLPPWCWPEGYSDEEQARMRMEGLL